MPCDVDSCGAHVVTVMYPTGPILVRSFPDLRIRRTIELPRFSSGWDLPVGFAGDLVLADAGGYGLMAFGADGTADVLNDQQRGWLIPAAHGTWLTVTGNTIRRAKIAGWPSGPPSQTIPLF
jgi:hypothetical protein